MVRSGIPLVLTAFLLSHFQIGARAEVDIDHLLQSDSAGERPSDPSSTNNSSENSRRRFNARWIMNTKDYAKFRYAIAASLANCGDIADYLPLGQAKWDKLYENTKRARQKANPQMPSDAESNAISSMIFTNLRYIFETRGVSIRPLSISRYPYTLDELGKLDPKLRTSISAVRQAKANCGQVFPSFHSADCTDEDESKLKNFCALMKKAHQNSSSNDENGVIFTRVPDTGFTGKDYSSPTYRDVHAHRKDKEIALAIGGSAPTNAHENYHLLNTEIRNQARPRQAAAVYLLNGRAILFDLPKTQAQEIRKELSLKVKKIGSIYKIYLGNRLNDPATDRSFGNLFDEWSATVAGGLVSIEGYEAREMPEMHVHCMNIFPEEWLYIVAASLTTLERTEPQYFEKGQQMLAAFKILAEKTAFIREKTKGIPTFNGVCRQRLDHFEHLRVGREPENDLIRKTLRKRLGASWTKKVLGF
jgi:hypothetical protein